MLIITALIFALCANIDNFTVGTAYGIKNVKISLESNLLIAIISCIGTFISMYFGKIISSFTPGYFSNILGSSILIILGLWFIMKEQDFFNKKKHNDIVNYDNLFINPDRVDADKSGNIDLKESLTLALALTINNFGLGIGASITGLSITYTLIFVFIFSILFIALGDILGKKFLSYNLGKYSNLISSIVIIALGIFNLFY